MGTSYSQFSVEVESDTFDDGSPSVKLPRAVKNDIKEVTERLIKSTGTRGRGAEIRNSTIFELTKESFRAMYKNAPRRGANKLSSQDIADKMNSYDKYAPKISSASVRNHFNDRTQVAPEHVGKFIRAFRDIAKERGYL